jgi:hypothetical protein
MLLTSAVAPAAHICLNLLTVLMFFRFSGALESNLYNRKPDETEVVLSKLTIFETLTVFII